MCAFAICSRRESAKLSAPSKQVRTRVHIGVTEPHQNLRYRRAHKEHTSRYRNCAHVTFSQVLMLTTTNGEFQSITYPNRHVQMPPDWSLTLGYHAQYLPCVCVWGGVVGFRSHHATLQEVIPRTLISVMPFQQHRTEPCTVPSLNSFVCKNTKLLNHVRMCPYFMPRQAWMFAL